MLNSHCKIIRLHADSARATRPVECQVSIRPIHTTGKISPSTLADRVAPKPQKAGADFLVVEGFAVISSLSYLSTSSTFPRLFVLGHARTKFSPLRRADTVTVEIAHANYLAYVFLVRMLRYRLALGNYTPFNDCIGPVERDLVFQGAFPMKVSES